LLARQYKIGLFKGNQEGEAALKFAELIAERSSKQRQETISEIIRQARNSSKPSLASQPRKPASVKTSISHKRNQHQRQASHISELVVNTPGCFIGKSGQRITVKKERKVICEIPAIKLTGITVASHGIALSADVIDHCAEKGIPVILLSPGGKVSAVVSKPESLRGSLAMSQIQTLNEGRKAFMIARRFVEGKIRNQVNLMKYYHKYRKHVDRDFTRRFTEYLDVTDRILEELHIAEYGEDLSQSRGRLMSIEGRAATPYWALFGLVIGSRAQFPGRERRGATDLVNSLLNYGYAILQSRVYLAILKAGLLPQISFLHALQKDHPALIYDLMEEFRPQVVDRTVLSLLVRREKVTTDEHGLLTDSTRKRLIVRLYERLAAFVSVRGNQIKMDEAILQQARLLAAHLRGESAYKPFVSRW
jgi:CRISPR-associated protein Cas1